MGRSAANRRLSCGGMAFPALNRFAEKIWIGLLCGRGLVIRPIVRPPCAAGPQRPSAASV